jgi:hypothetical protein
MERYGSWAPTAFDHEGAFLLDRQEWLVVPVILTRDCGILATSNFEGACGLVSDASVMDNALSFETHRLGHWGPGWFEILIVRPGSAAATAAAEIETRLEDYPVLDEDDYGEREVEYAEETWSNMSVRERVRVIQEHGRGVSVFAARHDSLPRGNIFEYCRREA